MPKDGNVDASGGNPWHQPGMEWAMRAGVSDETGSETDITLEQFVTILAIRGRTCC